MQRESFNFYSALKYSIAFAVIAGITVSCGSSKSVPTNKAGTVSISKPENIRMLDSDFEGKISGSVKKILKDAENYLGSPYKFGGNTEAGFDCSGLAAKVYQENNVTLPRRSADQAEAGKNIDIRSVKPGDLLFFATAGGSRVSHVGIVHTIEKGGEVKFIHASTAKGVIISSLKEKYWNKAYLHAQRVL